LLLHKTNQITIYVFFESAFHTYDGLDDRYSTSR
jgi:hypothetical protein